MINKICQLSIFVRNQEEAKVFYTENLGFEVCTEEEFAPGWKYVTVAPHRNCETVIEFVIAENEEQEKLIGKQAAGQVLLMLISDDIEKDFLNLQARGVHFLGKPQKVPGGKGVAFEDLYGNQLDIFEPAE